jgi:DNA polymerase I
MNTSINFIPIDYDYFDFNGKNFVKIIGRTDENKHVCIIDEFQPYFWAIFKQEVSDKKIKDIQERINDLKVELDSRTTKVEKTEICDKKFLGKEVKAIKIFVTNYKDAHPVADQIDYPEIEFRREYDIPLITRYITEKSFTPLTWKRVTGEILNNSEEFGGIDSVLELDQVIKLEKIEEIKEEIKFEPKIFAFDIECDEFEIGKGEILMISLAGKNFKKVLTWKAKECKDKQSFVESYKDEEEMLEGFVEIINKESPDILVGYFSDGFDMPYIKARAEKLGVKLSLGVDRSKPVFSRGKITSSSIFGRVHVDIFRFIETVFSQYLQSETLGLNEVALELLGEGKKEFEFKNSSKIKEHEWKDFFEYNLQDSVLTYKLMEKLWVDLLELSRIIQEPPWDITRSGMSQLVEDYILHNLKSYNEIAEKRPLHDEIENRRNLGKYEGAFVFQPKPGIYENVVMFDFTSMYSSVIVTFNLSKSTFLGNMQIKGSKESKEANEADLGEEGKAYFSIKPGFFPTMLREMVEKRKKYKSEYKKNENNLTKARSNSYKLLANAAYGYQGFFGARYYCREAAAATAALARKAILETIENIKKAGYDVVYSDTDSIAFLQDSKTKKETLEFLSQLNKHMPGIMELELEDFYKRGIWVTKRDGESGAKKKYALIDEKGKMKIRGFETVRRDWCDLARELQSEVLEFLLKEGNPNSALELVKKTIKDLKERKITREQIRVRTQLKKPLSEYKSITPHVIAAQKMKEAGFPLNIGMTLEYFIAETREKKALVREKVKLMDEKGEYNIKYYLEHQIIPAVENIFQVFDINIKELSEGSKQTKLF